MAIKYVEDYRVNTTDSDDVVIQAAIDDLVDGDTLMFGNKASDENTTIVRTYILDESVYFTSYNSANNTGVTRTHLTIDGRGCTVCGSSVFNDIGTESNPITITGKSLFYLSDKDQKGLKHCNFKNFVFKWSDPDRTSNPTIGKRGKAMAVISCHKSEYCSYTTIENCEFHYFGTGLYICGKNDIVKQCFFNFCNRGIYSDGATHTSFENNYFKSNSYGLHLNVSYHSVAKCNTFETCTETSIYCSGPKENSTNEDHSLNVTIANNRILGSKGNSQSEIGIKVYGGEKVIVTGNHIFGVARQDDDTDANGDILGRGYGRGVWVSGNLTGANNGLIKSKKIIVSDNYITGCFGEGIKIDNATDVSVNGNSIFNVEGYGLNEKKHGIFIDSKTNHISVVNNSIYYYGGSAIKNTSDYYTFVGTNNLFNKRSWLLRVIEDVSYATPAFTLPALNTGLTENEVFYMKIHDGYTPVAVTTIKYNGRECLVSEATSMGEGNIYYSSMPIPVEAAGKYAILKYVIEKNYDNNNNPINNPRFVYVGYIASVQ